MLGEVLAELKQLKASNAEVVAELDRLKEQQVAEDAGPIKRVVRAHHGQPRRDQFGCMQIRSDGTQLDALMDAEMYRATDVNTCPCGKVRFVSTQRFRGEEDIERAQQAKVALSDKGPVVVSHPWRYAYDPDTGESLIPEQLRPTPEKREHYLACCDERNGMDARFSDEQMRQHVRAAAGEFDNIARSDVGPTRQQQQDAARLLEAAGAQDLYLDEG